MVQLRYPILLTISLCIGYLAPIYAAEPLPLRQLPFTKIKKLFHPQSQSMAQAASPLAKAKQNLNDLHTLQQHTDKHHITHTRMQQFYAGVPVFGGYAILHSPQSTRSIWSQSDKTMSLNGTLFQDLSSDLGQPTSNYEQHGPEALQHFKSQFAGQQLSDETVSPIIYVDSAHHAHWAYKVSVMISFDKTIPERPTAIIDAQTFQPFVQWNDIKMQRTPVKGRGYGGNQLIQSHQFGEDFPLLSLVRNAQTEMCYMENKHVKVVDMMHRYEGRNPTMHFMCPESHRQNDDSFLTGYKGNGYDKINGAFSPSNDALYAGDVIYEMYQNWYGVNPLEENGKNKQLIMRVHFGLQFENAFWDGSQMTFGDGGSQLYPLVSLGVGAHEISHGFTEQHSDLAYFGQSGGMNESFSDMAAQVAENYATGTNSWKIGSEIVKQASGLTAFRFMDRPSLDGMSIDSADQYKPEMDVHHTSGVYNRLFYLLATTPNWDVRKAFAVMLTANTDFWTPTSTFDEGACGILDAAKSLDASLIDIKQALEQVGIHYGSCYESTTKNRTS